MAADHAEGVRQLRTAANVVEWLLSLLLAEQEKVARLTLALHNDGSAPGEKMEP